MEKREISYNIRIKHSPLAHSLILCYRYFRMNQKTVLIIEDEEDAAELFAEMMRVSGFHVRKTSTSTPALSMMTA